MELISLWRHQRGATLVIGLIMLAIITMLVVSAYNLSSTNMKAVGNMQFRNDATAASTVAIEQVMTAFTLTPPTEQDVSVDLDNDGTFDHTVHIVPTCITSSAVAPSSGLGEQGSVELGSGLSVGGAGSIGGYMTEWDIDATVTDNATGASTHIHQGVRKLLTSDCA